MDITRRPRLMQGGARQGLQVSVCATTTTTTNTKNDGVVRFCEMVDTAGKLGGAWQQQQQQDLSLSLPLSLSLYIYIYIIV